MGSSTNIARRIGEHLTSSSKASNLLIKAFKEYGIENFKLILIKVPADTSYKALLGLEQYFMLVINPSLCPIKVVTNPNTSIGVAFNVLKRTEEQLYNIRMLTGKRVYLYDSKGILLYVCLSIGQFVSLAPTTTLRHNLYYRHIDKGSLYKGELSLTSMPLNHVSLPTMSTELIIAYLANLAKIKFDYSMRKPNPKSNILHINVTSKKDNFVLDCKSAREAVKQIKELGVTTSRKRIDKAVMTRKRLNMPVVFTIGKYTFCLTLRFY